MATEAAGKPRKKRRTRTGHPGVKIRLRTRTDNGNEVWLGRWKDPDTGQRCECSLTGLGLTTAEARREWAIIKSAEITRRAQQIADGSPRAAKTPVPAAVELFLDRCRLELRPGTVTTYESNTAKFARWAEVTRIAYVESITPAQLARFRTWLASQPARRAKAGGRRGAKAETDRPSPATLNSDLAACRAMLNQWRKLGMLPKCTSDGIRDGLTRFTTERPRPPFLRSPQIRELLEAALRYDGETFDMTREEKIAGILARGRTRRFRPIAPLVLFSLLAGTRLGEATSLTWDNVHLDALDGAGEVIIPASVAKTRMERSIALDITPSLRELLILLRGRAGDSERVFDLKLVDAQNAMKRLVKTYGAPAGVNWKSTRSTCGTYLSNAPEIYGAASTYYSARRLGHSVSIAERHYLGLVRVPAGATTLEQAMGIEDLCEVMTRSEHD